MTDVQKASTSGVTVVFNPASGSAPDVDELREELGTQVALSPTTESDPGTGQAAEAIERGSTVVFACGGDGTVRAVLESLVGTDATLGILPFGTGNLLASNLGVPAGLDAFDDNAATDSDRRRIDVGRANGEAFAVMAGVGFDAEMMADAPGPMKKWMGTVAYVVSALRHLRDPLARTVVQVDGRTWFSGRSAMVLVGNFGAITGGIEVFPDARPDDGRLDVLVVSTSTVREWLSVAWRILRRSSLNTAPARRTSGTHIVVRTKPARPWEVDGEERPPASEVTFEIEPNALSVLVPEGETDA